MNSFNGEKYLKKSIISVINQNYKNWELIFWDNCSKDKSKSIINNFKDKRIKYYYSKKFNTLYKSRNLAINKARGKYISFLDVDDSWKKNKLYDQINKIEKLNADIIYSNYLIKNNLKKKIYLKKNSTLPEGCITQSLLNDYFLGIVTIMIKKNIFRKYRFNEYYNIIGDFDLFIKLSRRYKFFCIQQPLATYNIHENNMSKKKLDLYIKELDDWLKKNTIRISKNFSLKKLKYYLFKLKIKNKLNYFLN